MVIAILVIAMTTSLFAAEMSREGEIKGGGGSLHNDSPPSTPRGPSGPRGVRGPRGPQGDPGPAPTQDQILSALKEFESLREKGYKTPNSFQALIKESTERGIIVGFPTADGKEGIDYKWGKSVRRAEMAQFAGRLLKEIASNREAIESEAKTRASADQSIWEAIEKWHPGWKIALIAIAIFIAFAVFAIFIVTLGGAIFIVTQ